MQPTLREALRLARAGDAKGFTEIYNTLAASVTRFAHSRSADDPEGITNEVFLAAFRNLAEFTGDDDDLRGWIFTIARNKLIDDARRRSRRPVLIDIETAQEPTGDGDHSDAAVERSAGTDWVHEQLAVLTDEQRDVLMLRLVNGLTIAETAQTLGQSVGAIKALQRRGLRQLEKKLADDPYPSDLHLRWTH